jgi:hypothetical protein
MSDNLSNLKKELLELLTEEQMHTNSYVLMLAPASTATPAEIEAQRQKIVIIYNRRQSLYKLIQDTLILHNSTNSLIDDTYKNTQSINDEMSNLIKIKEQITKKIGQDKETKQQLISANVNYGKQYYAYRKLFIALIIILSCLIVVSLLSYTPLFMISGPLRTAIYIIGGAYVANLLIHMLMKSTSNNDEYDWVLSPNNNESPTGVVPTVSGSVGFNTKVQNIIACAGEYCCDENQGTIWSEETQTCVVKDKDTDK